MKQIEKIDRAFTFKSMVYDEYGKKNIIVKLSRNIIYQHVLEFVKVKDRILELNGGTGGDALFFAKKGYKIHTTDISRGMLKKIREKIKLYNLANIMSVEKLSITKIDSVQNTPYDYIFSNFGGINCIPNLALLTKKIDKKILKPGGLMTWIIMPPICPWELLNFPWNRKTAFRRLRSLWSRETKSNIDGEIFNTYYYTPKQVLESLGRDFKKISLRSLSLFSPPSFMDQFPIKYPKLYRLMVKLDFRFTSYYPFNNFGDFFILTVKFEPK